MPAKIKQKKENQINLLPQEGLSATMQGRVLIWLLSTFRFIIIVTELIVVSAFIGRFWLDAKNTDLGEQIQEDKVVIESYQNFENQFKNLQQRLVIYNAYAESEGKIIDAINSVITSKPPEVTYTSIGADENQITISAKSVSEIGIQQFLVNLKANEKIESVKLGDISASEEGSVFTFNIIVVYKKV
jgi:Tfp pilus assembly protein PilN